MQRLRSVLAIILIIATVTLTVMTVPAYRVVRDLFESGVTLVIGQPFRFISHHDAQSRLAGHFICWFFAALATVGAFSPKTRAGRFRTREAGRFSFSRAMKTAALLALAVVAAETGQFAVPGRNPSLVDICAGMLGILLSLFVAMLTGRRGKRKTAE